MNRLSRLLRRLGVGSRWAWPLLVGLALGIAAIVAVLWGRVAWSGGYTAFG